MKPEKVDVTIEKFNGNPLPVPVKFSFDFDAYESKNEIKAEDLLDEDEYTSAVNARRKAKKRAQATSKALDAAAKQWTGEGQNPYLKPDMNTPEALIDQQVKIAKKLYPHLTDEQAQQVAATMAKVAESLKA